MLSKPEIINNLETTENYEKKIAAANKLYSTAIDDDRTRIPTSNYILNKKITQDINPIEKVQRKIEIEETYKPITAKLDQIQQKQQQTHLYDEIKQNYNFLNVEGTSMSRENTVIVAESLLNDLHGLTIDDLSIDQLGDLKIKTRRLQSGLKGMRQKPDFYPAFQIAINKINKAQIKRGVSPTTVFAGERRRHLPEVPEVHEMEEIEGEGLFTSFEEIIEKIKVLLGEFQAGNKSKVIRNEISDIANFLFKHKVIPKNSYKKIIKFINF